MAINLASKIQDPAFSGADHFVDCLDRAAHHTHPYDHWLLDSVLPESLIDGVIDLPFNAPIDAHYEGTRECLNATRVHFSPKEQAEFAVCRDLVDVFSDSSVISAIEDETHAKLSKSLLRIEYCQDTDGYWLAPHPDLSVKLFTMLIYLSDDPNVSDAGTDLYDMTPEHNRVGTAPYGRNKGLIFIPAANTMHGFTKRPIKGVRSSLIINYVTSEWRSVHELASMQSVAD